MPLIGSDAIGVYGIYCRLEREDKVQGMCIKKIAKAARKGDKTITQINELLVECGFIRIEKPQGWEKLAHYTTRIIILNPPSNVSAPLIDKYSPVDGGGNVIYQPLTTWLIRTDALKASNDATNSVNECFDEASNDDAKIDPSLLNPLSLAGSPSPSAQSSSGGQEPIEQNEQVLNSRNSTSGASNSNAAVKDDVQPNVPDSAQNEPLIQALKEVYNLESYIPSKK